MQRIVILGAGTAGTVMANRLARRFGRELRTGRMTVTAIDQDNRHVYQPGLLFLPFGDYTPEEIVRPRAPQLPREASYIQAPIARVVPDLDIVELEDGRTIPYDVLIVATGTRVLPAETEGLTGPGWGSRMFEFYTLEGATALRDALAAWPGGRLVINPVEMPIKCPVAPLEFAFLADAFFTRRGMRDRVTITYVTPLDAAFTKPVAARTLGHLLAEKGIGLVTEFATGRADGAAGELVSWDERVVPFDLLVSIPLHGGAEFVGASDGLGDDLGFVITDPHTLQARRKANIFAIGDATNVPASKAGSVAHFEAEVLDENVARFLEGRPLEPGFDGHSNCFIETGHERALLIDFNYETEPLPGRFPYAFGPLSLLKESRVNHLGKLGFRWAYWHLLLPGHDFPGIGARMSLRGKQRPGAVATTT